MNSKMNIKSMLIMALIGIISLFFINMSLAANTGKISVDTVNLRETPDEKAKILELLSINESVEIIEKIGDWYKVKVRGIIGYLRQDLVMINEQQQPVTTIEETDEKQKQEEIGNSDKKDTEEQTIEKEEKEIELGEQKISENTKLKIVPVINATDMIEVKKEEVVNVIERINGWACVETHNTKGWIRKEKLQKEQTQPEQTTEVSTPQTQTVRKTAYVNVATVNVRAEANTSSRIVANVSVNTAVEVVSEANGWSQVNVKGKEGYILSTLLSANQQETSRSMATPRKANNNVPENTVTSATTETTNKEKNTKKQEPIQTTTNPNTVQTKPASGKGTLVVTYAKQFIGTKYTYGGTNPSTGFDCSGFTSYVYKHFGVNLPRTSGGQSGVGVAVNRSDLQSGDLVIYSGHVAIYVGGGQVIHAPRPGKTVCIVPLNQAASKYIGARRIV